MYSGDKYFESFIIIIKSYFCIFMFVFIFMLLYGILIFLFLEVGSFVVLL